MRRDGLQCVSDTRVGSQLKFRESEITRGMNELAIKRKSFESDTLAERMGIEAERERVRVELEVLTAEMSLEKRRQELLRLEQEHRQNIMKDFEESNRLQDVRDELAKKEIDFQKHVEEASAKYTLECEPGKLNSSSRSPPWDPVHRRATCACGHVARPRLAPGAAAIVDSSQEVGGIMLFESVGPSVWLPPPPAKHEGSKKLRVA